MVLVAVDKDLVVVDAGRRVVVLVRDSLAAAAAAVRVVGVLVDVHFGGVAGGVDVDF